MLLLKLVYLSVSALQYLETIQWQVIHVILLVTLVRIFLPKLLFCMYYFIKLLDWTVWLQWGTCSATDPCTIGTRDRARSCKDSISDTSIPDNICIIIFGDETVETGSCDTDCDPSKYLP